MAVLLPAVANAQGANPVSELEAITVLADELRSQSWQAAGNRSRLDAQDIARVRHEHPAELFQRLPGVWISRGDGQEHLTAIRSPVLTGPGSCGAFLLLENGLPIRPAGFCNANNLFEINLEQADDIEVIRGPASALYGGNALHGVINVRSVKPAPGKFSEYGLDVGHDDFARLRLATNRGDSRLAWRLDYQAGQSNGWRDDAGYEQQKLTLQQRSHAGPWQVESLLAGTWLQQETAGFILGKDAYQVAGKRRDNANPEAFRNAWSLRASTELGRAWGDGGWLSLTPYLRSSRMEFSQHFLPGQPLERNGQQSAGLLLTGDQDLRGGHHGSWSAQIEYADGYLQEIQAAPLASGSAFLIETRPAGVHYDYRVTSLMAASHVDLDWRLSERLRAITSARLEWLQYDYDNLFLTGNRRPDGSACGFGGCLFNRPADRRDGFGNLGARLGLQYALGAKTELYLSAGQGFRPPQTTELYRLQNTQHVADLQSERLLGVEGGGRGSVGALRYQLTLFAMHKSRMILRDANGFNIDAGKTRHLGVELDMNWRLNDHHSLHLAMTQARHTYRFQADAEQGERIRDGNDVDTAPRQFGSLRWLYRPGKAGWLEAEGVYMGPYALDAANDHHYGGHRLLNLRAGGRLTSEITLTAGLTNLTNRDYAERADYAFGNYRYFPGRSRQLMLTLDAAFD